MQVVQARGERTRRGGRCRWGAMVLCAAAVTAATVTAPAVADTAAAQTDAVDVSAVCDDAPRAPYVDIGDAQTHAGPIDCLHGLRVVQGRDVDRYDAGSSLRRDQMASLVARTLETAGAQLPTGDPNRFPDVDGGPHADAIRSLAELGVVEGRPDGRYHPAAPVRRGQMAAFVMRAHDHLLEVDDADTPEHGFEDIDGTTHVAYIARAAEVGIALGRSEARFAPDEDTRRDETATFLARLLAVAEAEGAMEAPRWEPSTRVEVLPGTLRRSMTGVSWRQGCPVPLDRLRLVETIHRDMDGVERMGLLVVHRDAVAAVTEVVSTAYTEGFPIERMRLVDRYGADDDRSMADNNTHAFNCRTIAGTDRWSEHAYGRAIDINPIQNPYVSGNTVIPSAGRAYLDRDDVRPGMVVEGGPVVQAFDAVGWGWGGRWSSALDYMHFSATGR